MFGTAVNPEAWIDAAAARLRSAGYHDVEAVFPDGRRLRAFRRADFRAEWFLTRLHTFVVFDAVTSRSISDEELRRFSAIAMRWAKRAKGASLEVFRPEWQCFQLSWPPRTRPHARAPRRGVDRRKSFQPSGFACLWTSARRWGSATTDPSRGLIYRNFFGEQQRLALGELRGDTMQADSRARVWLRVAAVGAVVALLGLVLVAIAVLLQAIR